MECPILFSVPHFLFSAAATGISVIGNCTPLIKLPLPVVFDNYLSFNFATEQSNSSEQSTLTTEVQHLNQAKQLKHLKL